MLRATCRGEYILEVKLYLISASATGHTFGFFTVTGMSLFSSIGIIFCFHKRYSSCCVKHEILNFLPASSFSFSLKVVRKGYDQMATRLEDLWWFLHLIPQEGDPQKFFFAKRHTAKCLK